MDGGWFSDLVDGVLGDNDLFRAIALAVLAAHGAALIAALVRRRVVRAIPALNLALALVVVLYLVSRIGSNPYLLANAREGLDPTEVGLVAFEIGVAVAAAAAFARLRFAAPISAAAFGLHLLASAAAVAFVLTFKIDRLI
jgi:hypothetical protein